MLLTLDTVSSVGGTGADQQYPREGIMRNQQQGYRTYLVAVVATSETEVIDFLVSSPLGPDNPLGVIDSWWIAQDDRNDGSDGSYDSAICVPYGTQMRLAAVRDQWLASHPEVPRLGEGTTMIKYRVEGNISGELASREFDTDEEATAACAALNWQAGAGGKYGVYVNRDGGSTWLRSMS